eukprot:jgi/Mesvir1/743/Mv17344-RA.1
MEGLQMHTFGQRLSFPQPSFSGTRLQPTRSLRLTTPKQRLHASASSKAGSSRPIIILPGLGNNTADYDKMVANLKDYGLSASSINVARVDWLRNALGLLDSAYWKGTLQPRPVLDWYLTRVHAAVGKARQEGAGEVDLIGHSAGGWLARLYMHYFGVDGVRKLITLGTPHNPPPRNLPGVIDQTRGLLYYVEEKCPRDAHADVEFVCIAGQYLRGSPLRGEPEPVAGVQGAPGGGASSSSVATKSTWQQRVVGQGYKQVCGMAAVWGDGVVPVESAHLPGAINLTLHGVYHSPVGADDTTLQERGESESPARMWYGSKPIMEQWISHLRD